ncbi:hypothetical protein AAG570_008477 [Ranatra chinensis]|uniref:Ribokinase n=1 Tax=Ranatra chinensis TaxID=642074 RepID=A0ABD0ZC62_9HEMI
MIDLVCYAPRLPRRGETLHGTKFSIGHGGKGANQCVAAAKLGASTSLIARLGDDSFGKEYLKSLKELGINTDNVILTPLKSSGMAQITVSESGDNHIVIVAGANDLLSVEDIRASQNMIEEAKVVIFQFETPLSTTVNTLQLLKDSSGKPVSIVNGAPALDHLDSKIFPLCDIFCVNESEAGAILREDVDSVENATHAAKKFLQLGCNTVIITLGSKGAVFATENSKIGHVPAQSVTPVDTTGAGDAFIGALAYFTAFMGQLPLSERIRRSCVVASTSVLRAGTQISFPNKMDLPEELFVS